MIHQTLIEAFELTLPLAMVVAFIVASRTSASVQTFLATVSWNG